MYESLSHNDNGDVKLARRLIELLGRPRAGLVTDIDGTISPIAARPEDAIVLPGARRALAGLRDHLSLVAVVTGRSVEDARRMVDVDGLTYFGNHGLEIYSHGRAEIVPEARPWVPRITATVNGVIEQLDPELKSSVIVENKGATASIHYRLTPDPDRARLHLLDVLARCEPTSGIRVEEGRRVMNLLPPLLINKGSAVRWMVKEHALDRVAYVGDDITDAHAFRALDMLRESGNIETLNIGVLGPESAPSVRQLCDVSVPSVNAVAELLRRVLEGLEAGDRMDSRAPSIGSD
ncbi:MAG: trehalose-phosphatase [Chloroflexi bacterium]|nr:trehalose-phosphatase [Chloroflexota bacterium]